MQPDFRQSVEGLGFDLRAARAERRRHPSLEHVRLGARVAEEVVDSTEGRPGAIVVGSSLVEVAVDDLGAIPDACLGGADPAQVLGVQKCQICQGAGGLCRRLGPRPPALHRSSQEIVAAADSLCYSAKNAGKFLKPRKERVHGLLGIMKQLRIVYRPLGVIGIITPWNGPFILGMNPTVQALMAGNTVLLKGSEVTPFSTQLVESIFRDAGLPQNVLQVIMGDGETGACITEAGGEKVSFTGSVRPRRIIAPSCGRQLIPCTLELGGKDAMIVCEDADIDRAAAGAIVGSCMNTGHYCCGTERIYVVEKVYDEFLAKVIEGTRKLRQGADLGFEEDVGAVFWDRQMSIIEDHVEDARTRGATIHVGGRRNPGLKGLYYEPTVMSNVDHDMKIMQEETFGPILCVQKVRDVEEAIRLANDSPYGLNGNVWTRDKNKGFDIACRIDTGAVSVNDMAMSYGCLLYTSPSPRDRTRFRMPSSS